MRFYKCDECDDLVLQLFSKDGPMLDCPAGRTEVKVGTIDASLEKHVPHIKREGDILKVQIGEVEHPMIPEHWIDFILAEKTNGFELIKLKPGDAPYAEFDAKDVVAIYEFCNLHGLWKAEIE